MVLNQTKSVEPYFHRFWFGGPSSAVSSLVKLVIVVVCASEAWKKTRRHSFQVTSDFSLAIPLKTTSVFQPNHEHFDLQRLTITLLVAAFLQCVYFTNRSTFAPWLFERTKTVTPAPPARVLCCWRWLLCRDLPVGSSASFWLFKKTGKGSFVTKKKCDFYDRWSHLRKLCKARYRFSVVETSALLGPDGDGFKRWKRGMGQVSGAGLHVPDYMYRTTYTGLHVPADCATDDASCVGDDTLC